MPTLAELGATFVRYRRTVELCTLVVGDPRSWRPGDPTEQVERVVEYIEHQDAEGRPFTFTQAQGLYFRCPKCGTHVIGVSFAGRGVAPAGGSRDREDRPSRWTATGSSLDDLTLSPSVDVRCWHGWIKNGKAA